MADRIQINVEVNDNQAKVSLKTIDSILQNLKSQTVDIKINVSGLENLNKQSVTALNSIVKLTSAISKQTEATAKLEKAHAGVAEVTALQIEAYNKLLTTIHSITSGAAEMEQALNRATQAGDEIFSVRQQMQKYSESVYSQMINNTPFQAKQSKNNEWIAQTRRAMQQGEESNSQYADSWGEVDAAQIKAHQSGEQVGSTISKIGTQAEKTGNSLLENAKKFATWMLLGNAISGVKRAFEEALDEMKAADSELVTVRKVTGMAADELERLNEAAFATATKYGESASEYLANVAEFARAGYGDTADELAELSVKTQIVGDTTADTANQFLLAVDAAYKYNGSITALSRVLDGANEIDNKYATSIEKIAGGLGIVAPVAAQANIGIDELTAAIGTITAVTQRSGTEAATALRAIILNIVGDTKTEIEDGATWTAGQIEGLSDIIKIYAKDAYDAAQASGEVLNPMKAIAGLAQSVKDGVLSASQLYEMVSDIGGKLRASQLTALVQNWDMYESMLADYASAYGSAEKEIENATDSWERKTKQLQNTWTEFIQKSINTSSIKGLLDLARTILTVTGNLGNAVSIISGLIITFKSSSIVSFFEKLGTSTKTTVDNLKSFGTLIRSALSKEEKRLSLITKTNTYQRIYNQLLNQEAIIQGKKTDEIDENTRAQIANTAAKKAAAAAIVSWIGLAVTAVSAISTAVSAIEAKAAQTRQQIIENSKATAEQVENLTELIQQYETLSKERKDGGAWDNTQISQAKSLQEQITSLVGDQAKQLDLVNGNYDEQTKKLKEILTLQAETGVMDASDAEKAALKNAKKAISRYGETVIPDGALPAVAETLKGNRFVKLGEGAYTVDFGAKSQITTVEDALAYFNEVKTLRAALFEDYGDTKLYKELSDYIAKYKDDFEELETAVKTKQTYQDILKAAETGDWSKVFLSDNDTGGGSSGGSGGTTASADDVKKLYEELEKAVNKRLDARKKEIDAMKEAYDLEKDTLDLAEKRLKVEEAEKALRSAESERTIRVYNAATGQWEWQADESAIEKAKDNLKDAEDALNDAEWQQEYNRQLREYEAEKAKYDEIFDTVDEITDSVRDIDTILADIADKQLPEFSAAFDKVKEVFGDAVKVTDTGSTNTGSTTGGSSAGGSSTGGGNAFKKATEIIASKAKAETADEGTVRVSDEVVTRLANAGKVPSFDFGQAAVSRADKNTQTFSSVTTNNKTTNNTSSFDRYYYINGFKVGNDAADRPLSEILGVLSIYKERD